MQIRLVARTLSAMPELACTEPGMWLWRRMRAAFPEVLAAVLMPDRVELVCSSIAPEVDRVRLARMLGQLARIFRVRGLASEVDAPVIVEGTRALAYTIRDLLRAPCRAGLVACPLAWPWTTHRDVMGASVEPWITAEDVARALLDVTPDFRGRLHDWVSREDAELGGTPLPRVVEPRSVPVIPLGWVADAVAAALRAWPADIRRRGVARVLFVAIAREQGWDDVAKLAELCACERHAITRSTTAATPAALHAVRLCVGDERLLRAPPSITSRSSPCGTRSPKGAR